MTPAAKAARNTAIEFRNRVLTTVQRDQNTAYRLLCSAVMVDPSFALGWFELGNATADLKQYPASIAAFRRALACPDGEFSGDMNPDLRAKALVNLGHRLLNDGHIEEAEQVTQQAIEFLQHNPGVDSEGFAFAYTNMSLVESIKGNVDSALEYALMGYTRSDSPIIETGLAFAHLFAGNYSEGLKHFEARFPYARREYLEMPYPRWNPKDSKHQTVFIATDHGAGDTLSFARFVPQAASLTGNIIFQVNSSLLRLMTIAMQSWSNIQVVPHDQSLPQADAWVPIMSLPVALGLTTEEIRDAKQTWKVPDIDQRFAPLGWRSSDPSIKLHIGIAYAGSPLNDIDRWRSIPVQRFLDLYQVPGVQLYSLQVGKRDADLHNGGCAALIKDMSPYISDACDTLALMRQLDLIITCESFVGHLAGAIGKECWVPVSARGGDFRCGRIGNGANGDSPLWYENTMIYWQGLDDLDWSVTFGRIVGDLRLRGAGNE